MRELVYNVSVRVRQISGEQIIAIKRQLQRKPHIDRCGRDAGVHAAHLHARDVRFRARFEVNFAEQAAVVFDNAARGRSARWLVADRQLQQVLAREING